VNFRILILIPMLSVLQTRAVETDFDRYKLIIDRQPFGQEPIDADAPQIVPAAQSFARNLRLSMLFEGPDGSVRVGIVDNGSKKSYILSVGEAQDELELVEADLQSSEAMLRKGNEVVLFKLEAGGSGEQISKKEQTSRQSSYAERRRALLQKIEERRKQAEKPPEPKLTGEALRKHLEEVQMDAIRNGLPPLPMQLTPEMDAQLVSEGVLPPQ
jgi:hypothetical protein